MNPKAGVWVWYLRGELTVTNTRHFGFSYGRVFEKKKIPAVHLHSFIVSWIRNYTLSRTNTHSHRLTECRLTAVIRDRTTCLAKYFPSLMKKLKSVSRHQTGIHLFPSVSLCSVEWNAPPACHTAVEVQYVHSDKLNMQTTMILSGLVSALGDKRVELFFPEHIS